MFTPFVLTTTAFGPFIVNRLDTGVSNQLFTTGSHEHDVVMFVLELLNKCYDCYGAGVHTLDIGANIGTCTIPWSKQCRDWGTVTAFEPQERIFYALAGNIALNNTFNARAIHGAVSVKSGIMPVPRVNYELETNFGGIAMKDGLLRYSPGQDISYDKDNMDRINCYSLDDLKFNRVDVLKIDVEGMEIDVLVGASSLISKLKPVIIVEWIHCGMEAIITCLSDKHELFKLGGNLVCVPDTEKKILDYVNSKLESLRRA